MQYMCTVENSIKFKENSIYQMKTTESNNDAANTRMYQSTEKEVLMDPMDNNKNRTTDVRKKISFNKGTDRTYAAIARTGNVISSLKEKNKARSTRDH